uniref:Procollagen C-endopeptidase enhancer n=1 Tax=Chrysemys picta bellii TaxID=8478 RepID=A0A8C3HUW6_CHRPI
GPEDGEVGGSAPRPQLTCCLRAQVPEGQVVILSFRVFDLEPDPSCRYDWLEVFNGHSAGAQRLGRFCGTFRPGALLSTGNRMLLRMVTDEGTGGRGFLVWFSAGLPHVNEHQFCGGKLEKPQGSLKTPNWPESNYPAGISCSWHIIAPVGQVVELTFGKFDVEDDTYCRYDYVAIFNGGATDDSRRVGKFCGDRAPGRPAPEVGASQRRARGPRVTSRPAPEVGASQRRARGPRVTSRPAPEVGASPISRDCLCLSPTPSGSSYIFMGRVDAEGVGKLSPESFVVPYRQQQHQVLTTLSKRPCGGAPKKKNA